MRWRLVVDESGRFDKSREETVVAGLLVSAGLFDGLQAAEGDSGGHRTGYPLALHAAHFQVTAFLALASSVRRGGGHRFPGSTWEWRDRAADTVLGVLERVLSRPARSSSGRPTGRPRSRVRDC